MGVTFDGDRSRKLVWFADKMVRTLQMLDLPAKMIRLKGFLLKVWQRDGLSGGRITAPMGAMISYATDRGVSVMVADSWVGGFNSRATLQLLTDDTLLSGSALTLLDRVSEEDMIAAGFSTYSSETPVTASPYYLAAPDDYTGAVWHRDALPTPCTVPVKNGEALWMNTSINLNTGWSLRESSMMAYLANGSNLGGRRTVLFETVSSSLIGCKTMFMLPSEQLSIAHVQLLKYDSTPAVGKYVGVVYYGTTDALGISGYYDVNTLAQHLPSGLATAINDNDSTTKAIGSYVFSSIVDDPSPTILTGMDITNTALGGGSPSAEDDYFGANPADEVYKLCYHFNDLNSSTVYTVDSSQFIGLLDHIATATTPATIWNDARLMFYQLWPRPNNNFTVPHDSVMFNAEDGSVYVWTRLYNSDTAGTYGGDTFNAFKFTRTGLFVTELVIPSAVENTTGVRPTITYAGDSLYLCVCETLETPLRVHEIHVGSPFTEWAELPTPTDGYSLVHVRPVRVKTDDIALLGVIEDEEGLYYLAFLRYKDSSGEWKRLAQIPAVRPEVEPDESNWSVCLFGDGEYVKEMSTYLSLQVAMPQMPVGPYAGYAGGMP